MSFIAIFIARAFLMQNHGLSGENKNTARQFIFDEDIRVVVHLQIL